MKIEFNPHPQHLENHWAADPTLTKSPLPLTDSSIVGRRVMVSRTFELVINCFNYILDSCSILFRYTTSFVWSSRVSPYPEIKPLPLSAEKKKELKELVENHAPKGMFDYHSASLDQISQVVFHLYGLKEAYRKHSTETAGKENLFTKVYLQNPKDSKKSFVFRNFDDFELLLPDCIAFLSKINTWMLNWTPKVKIDVVQYRLTLPFLGKLFLDSKITQQTFNLKTHTFTETTKQNKDLKFGFYNDGRVQDIIARFFSY